MIRLVSATGSFARSMVPLKAMPVIPVSMMEGISSKVIPPMATMGTAFNELSNTRALTSRTVISMYPFFKKHRDDLFELFNMVKTGGVKSLLSVRGGTLINNLRKG